MNEQGNGDRGIGSVDVKVRMAEVHKAVAKPREITKVEPEVEAVAADAEVAAASEAGTELEPLTWEHFDDRAKDIVLEASHSRHETAHAGHVSAVDAYIKQEEDPRLQMFGKLLLLAPRILEEDKRYTVLFEERREGRRLSADEQAQMERSARVVCAYNQIVGSLVAGAEEAMPPAKLRKWLSDATGAPEWAERRVFGVQVERAGEKLVRAVPEIENVMHGDLDQDLAGQDIIFDVTAAGYQSVDVKSRAHRGVMPVEVNERTGRVTLYIDPAHMDRNGYQVQPRFVDGYRTALIKVLVKGEQLIPESNE